MLRGMSSTLKITSAAQIDDPFTWVKLKQEYCALNGIGFGRKTSRQNARWSRLRYTLRARWQTFTVAEREECVRLFGEPINPPGA
jgi:hypothetical protein